jgi:hypothetical protein
LAGACANTDERSNPPPSTNETQNLVVFLVAKPRTLPLSPPEASQVEDLDAKSITNSPILSHNITILSSISHPGFRATTKLVTHFTALLAIQFPVSYLPHFSACIAISEVGGHVGCSGFLHHEMIDFENFE